MADALAATQLAGIETNLDYSFVGLIPAPLGIGTVTLDDATTVKGFICEPAGLNEATEITPLGGWRSYLHSLTR